MHFWRSLNSKYEWQIFWIDFLTDFFERFFWKFFWQFFWTDFLEDFLTDISEYFLTDFLKDFLDSFLTDILTEFWLNFLKIFRTDFLVRLSGINCTGTASVESSLFCPLNWKSVQSCKGTLILRCWKLGFNHPSCWSLFVFKWFDYCGADVQ